MKDAIKYLASFIKAEKWFTLFLTGFQASEDLSCTQSPESENHFSEGGKGFSNSGSEFI